MSRRNSCFYCCTEPKAGFIQKPDGTSFGCPMCNFTPGSPGANSGTPSSVVEQRPFNPTVEGSNPSGSATEVDIFS